MKVVCFCPEITDHKNAFHVEMNQEEFDSQVKSELSDEGLETIEDMVRGDAPDDPEKTYRLFIGFEELSQHNHKVVPLAPSFRAWPMSAMNTYTRLFINKEIEKLSDIRQFYIP